MPQHPEKSSISTLSKCLDVLKKNWKQTGNLSAILNEWPKLAGSNLAGNSFPLSLKRGILIIGASHPQWRQALHYNRTQLIASLRASGHNIKDIRIQQYHKNSNFKKTENEESIWERHPSRSDIHGLAKCNYCNSPAPAGEMALWGKCSFCKRKDFFSTNNFPEG